ncbi:MAG: hypothetical protein H6969_06530 [Gammaproteobacteria bacterium]|nr:hypothetical protein [Gammaproteobacteria bacterium]MCP5459994.1 hypothetical protein [Gammaproteobacteria bacterium]
MEQKVIPEDGQAGAEYGQSLAYGPQHGDLAIGADEADDSGAVYIVAL